MEKDDLCHTKYHVSPETRSQKQKKQKIFDQVVMAL